MSKAIQKGFSFDKETQPKIPRPKKPKGHPTCKLPGDDRCPSMTCWSKEIDPSKQYHCTRCGRMIVGDKDYSWKDWQDYINQPEESDAIY